MRRPCFAAIILVVSCLVAGCDDGGTATVTPDEARAAVDATKKWQETHSKPAGPTGVGNSPADVARKKH
jgi:hypothetical protein